MLKRIQKYLMLMAFVMGIFGVAVTEETKSGRKMSGWKAEQSLVEGVAAATGTRRTPYWVAPFDCEVGEIAIVNSTIVTGHDTNYKNINIIDGGAEGAGTSEIANLDLRATGSVNLEVGKTLLFDNIQGASAERFLSQGDVLEIEYELGGSGVLINQCVLYVVFRPANLSS